MEEKILTINQLDISYKEYNQHQSAPPIIFIHGWLDNAASFDQLIPLLANNHSLVIDLPGHGLSGHIPPYNYYHFIDGVSLLIELINQIATKPCILVGHSLGGCLASIVAGSIPSKIAKLVLLDAIGPLSVAASQSAKQYQKYINQYQLLANKGQRAYPSIDSACAHRAKSGYISSKLVRNIVERGLKKDGEHYKWRHDPRLLLPSPLKMTQQQVLSFLSEITAPTLLIHATNGFKIAPEPYQQRINAVANIKVETLDCGHHLHIEQPQQCAEKILKFLCR